MPKVLTTLAQEPASAATHVEQFVRKQNCATLVKLTAAGDQTAFAGLYDRTSGLLFGLLLRILGHSQTAEEVLEQVYAEIWRQASGFDEEREKPLTWLITIAHRQGIARLNKVTDEEFKKIRANNAGSLLTDDFNSEANFSEHGRLVRSAVNALSPAQREVLELAYFSGMKESEIAEYLGHPLETVRFTLNLAMKKLSALFSFLDLQAGRSDKLKKPSQAERQNLEPNFSSKNDKT